MAQAFDLNDVKRRMQSTVQGLKHDLNSLRTGRASASVLDPIMVEAYGQRQPLTQVATVSVPEPGSSTCRSGTVLSPSRSTRRSASRISALNPQTEGQTIRIRIPELNEQRRKELVKVAHKYAEEARVAVRHVRRDGLDLLKKMEKDGHVSKDDVARQSDQVQKATDQYVGEVDAALANKEKEIMQV